MKKFRYRALVQPANVLWKLSLLIPVTLAAQHPAGAEPHPVRAAEFIVKTFDQYPVVGITDLPGCEELHNLIRSVIREPAFVGKVQDIIVDFGNPLLQPLVDRYLIDGEITPRTLLRHIWDDTTRSVDLTWDSPVYEQFFDAVRSANSGLSRDKRLRVVLADSPIDWNSVKHLADLGPFLDSRSQVLATKINASMAAGRRALVIAFAEHQFRHGRTGNARQIIERANPGKFFTILTQGRLGVGDGYKAIENAQLSWDLDTVAPSKETWLTNVATSSEPNAPTVEAAAEAVLYLGPSDSLTMLRPSGSVFQDESYWKELNRRWMIVRGQPFNLAAARFDLRSRFMDPLPSMPRMPRPPRQTRLTVARQPTMPILEGTSVAIADFVIKQLDRYPIVGIGEVHTCLEFHQILHNLLRYPRLPRRILQGSGW